MTALASFSQKHLASSFLLGSSSKEKKKIQNKNIWPLSLLLPHFHQLLGVPVFQFSLLAMQSFGLESSSRCLYACLALLSLVFCQGRRSCCCCCFRGPGLSADQDKTLRLESCRWPWQTNEGFAFADSALPSQPSLLLTKGTTQGK